MTVENITFSKNDVIDTLDIIDAYDKTVLVEGFDKEGNEYLDENGNPRPSYVLNLGNVKYRLFPNQSDHENSPLYDVSFDIRANTYKKKE